MCRLVELFVVVDSKWREFSRRRNNRNRASPADLRGKEARGTLDITTYAVNPCTLVRFTRAVNPGNLGIVPFDRERDRRVAKHAEVVGAVGVFPECPRRRIPRTAKRLL